MEGQADDAAVSYDDVADLIDKSEDEIEDETLDDEVSEETTAEEVENDEPVEEQAANVEGQRIKLKLKNADGEEVEEEFSPDDLASGVMMDRDYRHKTMALAERERQATEIVQQQVGQAQQARMQDIEANSMLVETALGAFTDEKLSDLKEQDRDAWIDARERKDALLSAREALSQKAQALQQEQAQMLQAQRQETARQTWMVLNSSGITDKEVSAAFAEHAKFYGDLGQVDYNSILDPVSVMTIRDAVEYRKLQAAKPELTKRVKDAPKMPKAKAPVPQKTRRSKELDARFKSGNAKVRDLAAFIEDFA